MNWPVFGRSKIRQTASSLLRNKSRLPPIVKTSIFDTKIVTPYIPTKSDPPYKYAFCDTYFRAGGLFTPYLYIYILAISNLRTVHPTFVNLNSLLLMITISALVDPQNRCFYFYKFLKIRSIPYFELDMAPWQPKKRPLSIYGIKGMFICHMPQIHKKLLVDEIYCFMHLSVY
jgi:hypothetical protein